MFGLVRWLFKHAGLVKRIARPFMRSRTAKKLLRSFIKLWLIKTAAGLLLGSRTGRKLMKSLLLPRPVKKLLRRNKGNTAQWLYGIA